jgi:uncharacterized protein
MSKSIAIVGASTDRSKYGNKAVRAFKQGGWTVYPVNPSAKEVEGLVSYASIADAPGPIDRISMYVPPSVGKKMLPAIAAKAPKEFFLNPGSEDEDIIREAKALGLEPIQACSIVNIGLRPDMFPDR